MTDVEQFIATQHSLGRSLIINGWKGSGMHLLSVVIGFSSISRRQFSDKQLFKPAQWEDCRRRQQLTGDHGGTTDQLEAKEPNISLRNRHKLNSERVNIELQSKMIMFVFAGVVSSNGANITSKHS